MADAQAITAGGPKLRIGFVLAPRFTLAAFANFVDAIRLAADQRDRSRQIDCEWAVLGESGEMIEASCGLPVQTGDTLESPERFDYIVVVGGLLYGRPRVSSNVNTFLKAAAAAHIPLVALCTGSFILARAGLLNGYQVCVSWLHIAEFKDEFPTLNAESRRQFVIDRDRLTCAGGTSGARLAGHLIEKHVGRGRALKSLRIMIEEAALPANAWQPEEVVSRVAHDNLVKKAMLKIEQNIGENTHLPELARSLGISIRQLQRRFESDIGISVREYRRGLQLSRAKWLVEHSDWPMTKIALDCGFSDSAHFTRTFKEHFHVLPSTDRKEAGARRD
ncbi:GlxA family transcriptional regulator [Sphingopyxis sp. MSC1_008]|uniref:GlxA family transcriptional regulator n=1 Tax=Sphingopyxis sp. MSC1_008 TaxID=2909265 RepID=UPI0020C12B26|nr:GlxA family transcriptional regulator [Sphingopyxis sp. MSC1_008]